MRWRYLPGGESSEGQVAEEAVVEGGVHHGDWSGGCRCRGGDVSASGEIRGRRQARGRVEVQWRYLPSGESFDEQGAAVEGGGRAMVAGTEGVGVVVVVHSGKCVSSLVQCFAIRGKFIFLFF